MIKAYLLQYENLIDFNYPVKRVIIFTNFSLSKTNNFNSLDQLNKTKANLPQLEKEQFSI
jgi:hypothetical protein